MTAEDAAVPTAGPTAGTGLVRELLNFAVARGADRTALAERAGIEVTALEDQDARVPVARYLALIRAGKDLTGDPALALHFGAAVDMSQISVVGLLTHASETMVDALAQINRYGRLVIDAREGAEDAFQLRRRFDRLWLLDTRPRPGDVPEITETAFAQLVCGTRRIGIGGWLRSVHVTHAAPVHAAEYERVFQVPVLFGRDWNAMEFDEAYLTRRIAVAPRYLFGILSEHAEALLEALERSKTTRGRVESLLMPILHTGEAGMDRIAARMGLHRQALHRKLKAEGLTFEQLLDALRHRLALHYLAGNKVSVNETAYLLGFSDPASFSRAFKRWTGRSPRAFRQGRPG